jgi:hypothetical protein
LADSLDSWIERAAYRQGNPMPARGSKGDRGGKFTFGQHTCLVLASECCEPARRGGNPVDQDAEVAARGGHPAIGIRDLQAKHEYRDRDSKPASEE